MKPYTTQLSDWAEARRFQISILSDNKKQLNQNEID